MTSQDGQTYFKNLAASLLQVFKGVSDHFRTLCIPGLTLQNGNRDSFYEAISLEAAEGI